MVPGSLQREEDYQNADDTSHNFADPSTLPAGQIYRLTPDPLPTALGLLDGSHMQAVLEARSDNVFYFPRVNEDHNEPPSFATVLTSGGTVGPFLMDLAANKVPLDDADGYAFGSEPRGWGRTIIRLDFPGLSNPLPSHRFSAQQETASGQLEEIKRQDFAVRVAKWILDTFRFIKSGKPFQQDGPYHVRRLDMRLLRLLSINYYRNHWIPVIGYHCPDGMVPSTFPDATTSNSG